MAVGFKNSLRAWVIFQSAHWVNFRSAPTVHAEPRLKADAPKPSPSPLIRLAQVRFGDVPAAIQAAIADAELEQLEHWLERLVTAPSLAAIFTDSAH